MSGNAVPKNSEATQNENKLVLWFVARGSVLKGPYTSAQLETCLKNKEISHLDFCWKQGYGEWRPIASIDDFERRKEMRVLPAYPSVPVPSSSANSEANEAHKNPLSLVPRREQNIKISFARSPRQAISLYEWGLAIIMAVGLAYFSTIFALNEVERGIMARFELALLGREESLGVQKWGALPQAWEPLLSAPEFMDLAKAESFQSPNRVAPPLGFGLPVKIEAPMVRASDSSDRQIASVGGYRVEDFDRVHAWDASIRELDPIYIKPYVFRAHVNPLNPAQLFVPQRGEPYLNVLNP